MMDGVCVVIKDIYLLHDSNTVYLFSFQLPGGDSVQSDPRPEGLPLLRRARLQGHVHPHAPPRPAVHLAVQHARGEQLAVGRRRLGDQSLFPNASHVHVLPGLGRLQLHLQRDADRRRRDGEFSVPLLPRLKAKCMKAAHLYSLGVTAADDGDEK